MRPATPLMDAPAVLAHEPLVAGNDLAVTFIAEESSPFPRASPEKESHYPDNDSQNLNDYQHSIRTPRPSRIVTKPVGKPRDRGCNYCENPPSLFSHLPPLTP
jgi:hypothetical protein